MKIAVIVYCSLLASFSILTFIRNDYWIFRICEYPRWQKLIFSVFAVAFILLWIDNDDPLFYPFLGAMVINIIYLSVLVLPFTSLGKKQVLRSSAPNDDESVKIMIHNILQFNKEYRQAVSEVMKTDPDILVLLETDRKWLDEIGEIRRKYEYSVEIPLDNTYGMLVYSKLELRDAQVKYLVDDEIPSVHTEVVLRSGRTIRLFVVHPCPPSPDINVRSTERDAELLKVADLAKASKVPVIVVGDLNDVAWSYTTKLFLKMSRLLDPRRGRGMYNTFNAKKLIFRFPLDHAFFSADFKLRELRRLSKGGSDHFPILVHVQYEENASKQQKPLQANAEDRKLAMEKKAKV